MEVSFKQIHQQVLQTIERQAKSRTIRAANVIKKASNAVLSNAGGRSGKIYRKPHTSSTYRASAPGEPPALRTGHLRASWRPLPISEMAGGGKVYTPGIHTDVPYAPMLEDGTPKMDARPYADKIKQEAWPEVKQIYEQPYF